MNGMMIGILGILFVVAYTYRTTSDLKYVTGDGNLVNVSEAVEAFNAIEISQMFDVHIVKGDIPDVTLKIDENLVEYLDIYTLNDTLHIGLVNGVKVKRATLKAVVTASGLEALRCSGATKTKIDSQLTHSERFALTLSGASSLFGVLESNNILLKLSGASNTNLEMISKTSEIVVSGASELNMKGALDNLKLRISGASSIKARDLHALNSDVRLSGATSLRLSTSETIRVDASGGSDIIVYGKPKVLDKRVGSSSSLKFK